MGNEDQGGDGSLRDDLKLASDINDWAFAGRKLLRVVERLGDRVPPLGPGPAAELSRLIAAADVELARLAGIWAEVIRPGLTKHEDHPIPPLSFL
jgi:hypothetical protein